MAYKTTRVHDIRMAEQNGKARGYTDEDIHLAIFAVVALLDESILNLRQPVFNEWVRKPLQEELFGRHVAGDGGLRASGVLRFDVGCRRIGAAIIRRGLAALLARRPRRGAGQ